MEDKELDELLAKQAEREHKRIWDVFQTRHLKLYIAKQMLNYMANEILMSIPERKPETAIEVVIDEWFKGLAVVEKKHAYAMSRPDTNFATFLAAARRMALFVMREDLYYRTFVAGAAIMLSTHVRQVPVNTLIPEEGVRGGEIDLAKRKAEEHDKKI